MRLAIIGYGKMGKSIENLAKSRGHAISRIIGQQNDHELNKIDANNTDVAIEFSTPEVAGLNIKNLLASGIPVVSGTTGWLDELNEVIQYAKTKHRCFFYASNFSYSLYLFNQIQKDLAKIMNGFTEYDIRIEEIHHIEKKDKPSGTAISLANVIIEHIERKSKWVCDTIPKRDELLIQSKRISGVPGTHNIIYSSNKDEIMIQHKAKDRQIFAIGALDAAEFIMEKTGFFTMADLIEHRMKNN